MKILKVNIGKDKGIEKKMSQGDMLVFFDDMINDFSHSCVAKNCGYQENLNEFEDFKQILSIRAIDAYNNYDYEKKINFSTVLHIALQRGVVDEIRKNESKIRKTESKKLYIDAPIGEDGETSIGLIPDNKEVEYFKEDKTKLEKFLCENLTVEEMIYCVVGCTKQMGKASNLQKECLGSVIDIFRKDIGFDFPTKKEDLAIKLNLSRPTLNKRIKQATKKLYGLGVEYGLSNLTLGELRTLGI